MDLTTHIKNLINEYSEPIQYTDTAKMTKKEKDQKIMELEETVHRLQTELAVRRDVENRYINGLINSKYNELIKLMENPILTFPDSTQVEFNNLSKEQLLYLQSLGQKGKTM